MRLRPAAVSLGRPPLVRRFFALDAEQGLSSRRSLSPELPQGINPSQIQVKEQTQCHQDNQRPLSHRQRTITRIRATAAILAGGCADGVPSMALRYWSSHGGQETEMPVFITWLLGVGRSCLTVNLRPLLPERQGLVRRHRVGAPRHAVPAGPGPDGGDAGQPGPAAAAEAQRAGLGGPGPPRHEAGPAHRARGPPGAASPCSGTWSGIPPCWPGWRPAPTFASRWRERRPWRRYPRSWITLPTPAWGPPAPDSTAPGPRRGPYRRSKPNHPGAGDRGLRFRERMDRQLPQTFAGPQ